MSKFRGKPAIDVKESKDSDEEKDLRHQHFLHLKDQYFSLFRTPNFQGAFEWLIPLIMTYSLASFKKQWLYFNNSWAILILLVLKYFRTKQFSFNAPTSLLALAYLGYSYLQNQDGLQLVHFALIYINLDLYPKYLPGTLSVAELYLSLSAFALYLVFGLDSLVNKDERLFIQGNNAFNIYIFSPWWALYLSLATAFFLHVTTKANKTTKTLISFITGIVLAIAIAIKATSVKTLFKFVHEILTKKHALALMTYMFILLSIGLVFTYSLVKNEIVAKNLVRKVFHILSVVLFVPGIYLNTRFMVFAFNCFSVLLIYVELVRYFLQHEVPLVKVVVDTYFKRFCDKREKKPNAIIVTHIFLLLGCAYPVTFFFILADGGFLNQIFLLYSFSGVMFIGIGDTMASVVGSKIGRTRWGKNNNKTLEGSVALVVAVFGAYYILSLFVYPKFSSHVRRIQFYDRLQQMAGLLIATVLGSILEGRTMQFDNFICSIFYCSALIHSYGQ